MAKYTTSVRSICEAKAGLEESKGKQDVAQIIESARPSIFDFSYPIYDEEYRQVLETKILRHYYTREIGLETVGLWQLFLETRMNEIMPYYNKLYQSELLLAGLNPLQDIDLTKTGSSSGSKTGQEGGQVGATRQDTNTGTISDAGTDTTTREATGTTQDLTTGTITDASTGTTDSTKEQVTTEANTGTVTDAGSSSNTRTDNLTEGVNETSSEAKKNDHWDYYSDTPQGTVGNLANLSYLTNARHITDDGTGSSTTKASTKTNTGTVADAGTTGNTRTLDTAVNGTLSDTSQATTSNENTRTFDTSVAGTTTQQETGTVETENTRTLNTATNSTTSTTSNTTTSASNTEEYLEHIVGRSGKKSTLELLEQLRKSFLNIDMLIIRDLADLFFGLWE